MQNGFIRSIASYLSSFNIIAIIRITISCFCSRFLFFLFLLYISVAYWIVSLSICLSIWKESLTCATSGAYGRLVSFLPSRFFSLKKTFLWKTHPDGKTVGMFIFHLRRHNYFPFLFQVFKSGTKKTTIFSTIALKIEIRAQWWMKRWGFCSCPNERKWGGRNDLTKALWSKIEEKRINSYPIIHDPTSSGVSEVRESKRTSEHSGARERSE